MSSKEMPEVGEAYECGHCGMRIEVTVDCKCKGDDGPEFRCCGAALKKDAPK